MNRLSQASLMKMSRDSKSKILNPARKTGPRLPPRLLKEINRLNPTTCREGESSSDEFTDVYEYEEGIPEEESNKNKRFDPIENYEYELPENFKDENVTSEDSDSDEDARGDHLSRHGAEAHEGNGGRHVRVLQEITGLPSEAFERRRKKSNMVITEPYPESEYNPSSDVLDGDNHISVEDLLNPLHDKPGFSKLRKRMHQVEKKSAVLQTPLPKIDQERIERKAAYQKLKQDITKWEPVVKKNREAPTLFFGDDQKLEKCSYESIVTGFVPRSDFEKKMASIEHDVEESHKKDRARLVELCKKSPEDVKIHSLLLPHELRHIKNSTAKAKKPSIVGVVAQKSSVAEQPSLDQIPMASLNDVKDDSNQQAKMRSLLFQYEARAKRIKKIKSKTYHRLSKKGRMKVDPEADKELAKKQEFKRAEERMTLRHKNTGKWAKRIKRRGEDAQDDGTRAALSEQHHQHSILTRKMNSMKNSSSSSEDSSDDEDDNDSEILAKAKDKTLQVIQEEDEMPKSGVLALPFMVRSLKKRKEEANEEAKLAMEKYESWLDHFDDKHVSKSAKVVESSGRRVFNAPKKEVQKYSDNVKRGHDLGDCDSEDDILDDENVDIHNDNIDDQPCNAKIDHDPVFMDFEDVGSIPAMKTTYEASICVSGSCKKVDRKTNVDETAKGCSIVDDAAKLTSIGEKSSKCRVLEVVDDDSDSDGEEHMIDGILSRGSNELPSQAELLQSAFAGDDVEKEFEEEILNDLNEKIPEPDKVLPGWGNWDYVQRRKGMLSWMGKESEMVKEKINAARKANRELHGHVIINDGLDKKAEKLFVKKLPYPYTSEEVFESSFRMPLGPDFNPATVAGALVRPQVMKRDGAIYPIKFPLKFPLKSDEHVRAKRKRNNSRKKGNSQAKT